MATPPVGNGEKASPAPRTPATVSRTPLGLRLLEVHGSARSAASDEAMWRRLKDAGFDEEMIKRRDKAALVAYITKLESELYEYQHHMGLLILERKDWMSKYDDVKKSADLADINHRHDLALQAASLAEAEKREENLKKALRVEKECVTNLEKTLHEMRAEYAESKVAAECRLSEANILTSNAQKKLDEAESKMRAAESLSAEATLFNTSASRKLQDVEAREDDLRRRMSLSKSELDAKEKDIILLRQSAIDTQKILLHEREKLHEQKISLNQREDAIFERSKGLDNMDKELRIAREKLEKDLASLKERESSLTTSMALLVVRDEAVVKRECQLDRRESELLISQESNASKAKEEIQRLRAENDSILEKFKFDIEAKFSAEKKLVEDELDAQKQRIELMDGEIVQRVKLVEEREKGLEIRAKILANKEADIASKLQLLFERENHVSACEKKVEEQMSDVRKEQEEIKGIMMELERVRNSIEDEKKQLILAHEKLEITSIEKSELSVLRTQLKDEIDSLRAQKLELVAEADRLRTEKEKFEAEWDLLDEKMKQIQREVELVEQERLSVNQFLKNEHDSLQLEKDMFLEKFKKDSEILAHEREDFMRDMEREHSEWFNKIQRERDAFLEDIKIQKRELEINIERRRAEIETYLREKEEAFEKDKRQELEKMDFQKENFVKELEHLGLEREKLKEERMEIAQEREIRNKEWSEMKGYLNELELQREKLQKARELLEADRKEIIKKIQELKEVEKKTFEAEQQALGLTVKRIDVTIANGQDTSPNDRKNLYKLKAIDGKSVEKEVSIRGTPTSTPKSLSWIRKYVDAIFGKSPEQDDASKCSSPANTSDVDCSLATVANSRKFDDFPDSNGSMKGIMEAQTFKSVAERSLVNRPSLCKGTTSICIGPDKNLAVDKRLSKENTTANVSSLQDLRHCQSRTTNGDSKVMPLTRKRSKDTSIPLDMDAHYESLKKYQKRKRQDEDAGRRSKANVADAIVSTEEVSFLISSCEQVSAQTSGEVDGTLSIKNAITVSPQELNIEGSTEETGTAEVAGNIMVLSGEENTLDIPHIRTQTKLPVTLSVETDSTNVGNADELDASDNEASTG